MKIYFGDLFKYKADYIGITTNGYVKSNGACVMGKGTALIAKKLYPGLDRELGQRIKSGGNVVHLLTPNLFSIPVKHNWREGASLALIEESLSVVKVMALHVDDRIFAMPTPGTGNGGLGIQTICELLIKIDLPDNVVVVENDTYKFQILKEYFRVTET